MSAVIAGGCHRTRPDAELPAARAFRDGDVVAFVGDSITKDGHFLAYIEDFYLTRFPDAHIRFVNAGVPGDTASGALRRFDWDVAPARPTVVSLMFGMNDVDPLLYGASEASFFMRWRARRQAIGVFSSNLETLAERCRRELGADVILVTPTPYDEVTALRSTNLRGIDGALARCRERVLALAQHHGWSAVDAHAPLSDLIAREHRTHPAMTVIGPDRIHPQPAGHLALAYLYLRAQHAPSIVAEAHVDAAHPAAVEAVNSRVTDVAVTNHGLAFAWQENALPFPIDPAAREALAWFPIEAELNRERLVVSLADHASYELRIDGLNLGTYTADALKAGIDLGGNLQTPQAAQALDVLRANEHCRLLALRLREIAAARALLLEHHVMLDDPAARIAFLKSFVASHPDERDELQRAVTAYDLQWNDRDELQRQLDEAKQALHARNRPVPHRISLERVQPRS